MGRKCLDCPPLHSLQELGCRFATPAHLVAGVEGGSPAVRNDESTLQTLCAGVNQNVRAVFGRDGMDVRRFRVFRGPTGSYFNPLSAVALCVDPDSNPGLGSGQPSHASDEFTGVESFVVVEDPLAGF